MPELPEVETLRRELEQVLVGKTFAKAKVLWPKMILPLSPRSFNRQLKNQLIGSVERRAKILFIVLNKGLVLAIHLKMTGQLVYQGKKLAVIGGHPEDPSKHTRIRFSFTDKTELLFNDLRKFGWVRLMKKPEREKLIAGHGIEPLQPDFTLKYFQQQLERFPKRRLKQFLLDQTIIAGLGNIYADETAFAAGLRPARPVGKLNESEINKLQRAIKSVLRRSIKKGGTSFRDYRRSDNTPGGFVPYLQVYGRGGEPCKVCGASIEKIKFAGRGTHYCPECQK